MTTLAIQGIQSFARGGVRAVTALALNTATGFVSRALDNRVFEGPRLESFHLQTSRDGAPMPRVFGRVRLAGQVIWASRVRETMTEESVGGKGGGPTRRDYSYSISFAVGLCEGEILGVDRIWANGEVLSVGSHSVRVHLGTETQGPDSIIAATEGQDAPAFRGTAYIVFEDFPLDDYGSRLPIINAEIVRRAASGGAMETFIRSVNLLPGTGEFVLSPTLVEERIAPGETIATNMNSLKGQPDILTSLDQLQAELPNVKHVSVICSWFGSSLECSDCLIRPGVENNSRQLIDQEWSVAGVGRSGAYVVSQDALDRPNYGGTPSDDSLIACLRELKQRGFSVTLYPFILMDMPDFPWRGRITSSNDQTVDLAADVDDFFGTDDDFRFRHHILHYARLAALSRDVDGLVIGTEMRTLMALRDEQDEFPAVDKMVELASDVRAIVGPSVKLTYAADWSDYFGHQSGDDLFYHLDKLWASPNIDAVGIDAYFPLSDWRDGDHLDGGESTDIYDLGYLSSQIEGGEGYDYYYASDADRAAQLRTPITDGAHNKPWVFRYKDIRSWWANPHVERRDGAETAASPWVPRSKPIWLMEYGCPAVDKGANQPNVFFDGRSIDSALPYFSSGRRDDLMQRRYIEALLTYYEDNNEPGFIDLSRSSCWTWDGRPYPEYPALTDIWSDGPSWERGHWLNGRTGLMPVADVIRDIAAQTGLLDIDVSGVSGVVPGYQIDRPMSARAALEPLLQLFDIEISERSGRLTFAIEGPTVLTISEDDMVAGRDGQGPLMRVRADPEKQVQDVRLTYIDAARDYQLGSQSARQLSAESVAVVDLSVPACIDEGFARYVADRELDRFHNGEETAQFSLDPVSGLRLHVGDRFLIEDDPVLWRVDRMDIGGQIDIVASRESVTNEPWVSGVIPEAPEVPTYLGAVDLFAFDLPGRSGVSVGASLDPFEPVTLLLNPGSKIIDHPVRIGASLSPLAGRSSLVTDRTQTLKVMADGLILSSLGEDAVLAAGNRFAIETPLGWEVIGAQNATLTAPGTYTLTNLLRGLDGSDRYMADSLPAGARIVWLDRGIEIWELSPDWRGETVKVQGATPARAVRSATLLWNDRAGESLSPVHPRWDGQTLSWIGRDLSYTDWVEDSSDLRFELEFDRSGVTDMIETQTRSLDVAPFDEVRIYQIALEGRRSLPLSFVPEP